MQFIHVKNLERYQDGYKDRRHYFAKIYIDLVQGDPECEMLSEIDFARLVKFIVLESCTRREIPADENFLVRKGFDFGLRSLAVTIKSLAHFLELKDAPIENDKNVALEVVQITNVTENTDSRNTKQAKPLPRVEKSRVEKNRDCRNETSVTDPRVKTFINWWYDEFKARFQAPYNVTAKDAALVKRLLGTYPLEKLKELSEQFFESDDPFIVRAGRTIGVFSSQVNKLIQDTSAYKFRKELKHA